MNSKMCAIVALLLFAVAPVPVSAQLKKVRLKRSALTGSERKY